MTSVSSVRHVAKHGRHTKRVPSRSMNDTVEQPALVPKEEDAAAAALVRIAGAIELLANVLAGFPEKNPNVWRSPEWAKQLKDLTLACEHLRQHARQLEDVAENLNRG
jgi:hypothetical protein